MLCSDMLQYMNAVFWVSFRLLNSFALSMIDLGIGFYLHLAMCEMIDLNYHLIQHWILYLLMAIELMNGIWFILLPWFWIHKLTQFVVLWFSSLLGTLIIIASLLINYIRNQKLS